MSREFSDDYFIEKLQLQSDDTDQWNESLRFGRAALWLVPGPAEPKKVATLDQTKKQKYP
jgi:hypothetical protein